MIGSWPTIQLLAADELAEVLREQGIDVDRDQVAEAMARLGFFFGLEEW